jgi:PleD family two-component response regulator
VLTEIPVYGDNSRKAYRHQYHGGGHLGKNLRLLFSSFIKSSTPPLIEMPCYADKIYAADTRACQFAAERSESCERSPPRILIVDDDSAGAEYAYKDNDKQQIRILHRFKRETALTMIQHGDTISLFWISI